MFNKLFEDGFFIDEYLEFEHIENKLSSRPDLHAFLLLDKLQPAPGRDIISASEHDEFYLSIDCRELEKVITQDQVLELYRCGVMYSDDCETLSMFS
jgi:hypothetical protein